MQRHSLRCRIYVGLVFAFCATLSWGQGQSLFNHVPIIDGDDSGSLYDGLHGFLYGSITGVGSTTDDPTHDSYGKNLAANIVPLPNHLGTNPAIVAVAIGMSHFTQELCHDQNLYANPIQPFIAPQNCDPWSFIYKLRHLQSINAANPNLVVVDCAQDGSPAEDWTSDDTYNHTKHLYTDCKNWLRNEFGFDESQVQIVLFKGADTGQRGTALVPLPNPFLGCPMNELPGSPELFDACNLMYYTGVIARYAQSRYPNLKEILVQSRSYGGYAQYINEPLNPDPEAYEQGFAMKWVINSQVNEIASGTTTYPVGSLDYTAVPPVAPWINWGPYIWAAGTMTTCLGCPISGLTWRQDVYMNPSGQNFCGPGQECDFIADDTHPSGCGRDKVSSMQVQYYCNSPYSTWMRWPTPQSPPCWTQQLTDTCNYPQYPPGLSSNILR